METASQPPRDPNPVRLSAKQAADRMGLTTQQLQALRLRGIGPPIVQKGLDIHYPLAEVVTIEEHEARAIFQRILQLPAPLVALRMLCDHYHINPSPILKEVRVPELGATNIPELPAPSAFESSSTQPHTNTKQLSSAQIPEPSNKDRKSVSEKAWYLIHTKPRQEATAITNLERQGYRCYLPKIAKEVVRGGRTRRASEAMFPRYLFIQLDAGLEGQSWGPIRSTRGVEKLVQFGETYPRIDERLIESLKQRERDTPLQPLLKKGEVVTILDGPFKDLDAVFYAVDSEHRVIILMDFLLRQLPVKVDPRRLKKHA